MKAFSYLAPKGGSIGVAVSGGSDSMALLMLAADYRAASGVSCFAVTIDHGLRPEAKEEVKFVARACKALGVAHHALRWKRDDERQVSQDSARQARHRLMADWAREQDIGRIALGHTRDDRMETFLMRARQGSGWHGLAGPMPEGYSPVWPEGRGLKMIRPLLAFGREELREELRARGVAWVEDPSNDSSRFERVRMRRLLQRMDARSREKTLKVMDRLANMRTAVAEEACSLFRHRREDAERGEADIRLAARELVGAEAWFRFIEAHVMAAGGGQTPPRRDAMERLLTRIAKRDPALDRGVTLAGAKIRVRKDAFLAFSKAPPRRGQTAGPGGGEGPDWGRAASLLAVSDLRVLSV